MRKRAEKLLKTLDGGGKIDDRYPFYPIQAWQLGDARSGLLWVALGGEVVIDYNLRLKRELGEKRPLWITGYANDVDGLQGPLGPRSRRKEVTRGGFFDDRRGMPSAVVAGDRGQDCEQSQGAWRGHGNADRAPKAGKGPRTKKSVRKLGSHSPLLERRVRQVFADALPWNRNSWPYRSAKT